VARRRGTRRLTHPSGVARPLDGVSDVGPSDASPGDTPPVPTAPVVGETFEERLERWYRERERYERRRAVPPESPA
jgi:hypothetical protein